MNSTGTRRGRPRNDDIDAVVLAAAGEVLDLEGFNAVAMQDVARRAGVSKTAVYRRWPSRERLVLDTLRARIGRLAVPDSGCVLCDLHEVLASTTVIFCSLGAGTLAQLLGESAVDPNLRTDLLAVVIDPIRSVVADVLRTATARGDLRADADLGLSVDTLCAVVFHRLLLDQTPLTSDQLVILVGHTLRGIAVRPQELLAQYEIHAESGSDDHQLHAEVDQS